MTWHLSACTTLPKMNFKQFMEAFGVPQSDDENTVQHIELKNIASIEALLLNRQYNAAYTAAKKFQQTYKNSEYQMWTRVLEAEALSGMGMHSEAIDILKSVILLANSFNEEITAYALFIQAKSYESIGESESALASFLDVISRREVLPNYISEIELPLELAQTYSSLGLQADFYEYSSKAVNGLNQYLNTRKLTERQKAHFLMRLGRIGPWQIRSSQYDQDFSRDQNRLNLILQSAQVNALPESEEASQYLIQILKEYEQLVQQFEMPTERDEKFAAFERRQSLSLSLLDTQLSLFGLMNENPDADSPEGKIRNYLDQAIERTKDLLEKVILRNPLTKESIQFRNIKKSFIQKPNQYFLEETKKNIFRPEKDPNL